jgi:hypothetical protein
MSFVCNLHFPECTTEIGNLFVRFLGFHSIFAEDSCVLGCDCWDGERAVHDVSKNYTRRPTPEDNSLQWDRQWAKGRPIPVPNPDRGKRFFRFRKMSRLALRSIHLLFSEYRGTFEGVKRFGLEVDHSPPPSAEVESKWSYTAIPPIRFHGVDREYFPFTPS